MTIAVMSLFPHGNFLTDAMRQICSPNGTLVR